MSRHFHPSTHDLPAQPGFAYNKETCGVGVSPLCKGGFAFISRKAGLDGGANRDRTDDLYNAIVALSQLSYGPTYSNMFLPDAGYMHVNAPLTSTSNMQSEASLNCLYVHEQTG